MQRQPYNKPSRSNHQSRQIKDTTSTDSYQHGLQPFILSIPAEALGHITAYLDPPALLSLARVSRLHHEYVANDVVWLRAFLAYFLGIGPEIEADSVIAAVPRLKATWRDEYISRFKLWAPITQLHIMVDGAALLSASELQGVIARSHVLTGKKFKGFIDSTGTLVQRPNGDHSIPAVMALASDGGTGKAAWGFYSGDIAVTRMPHVMDLGAPRHIVCSPEDAHVGAVSCLEFSQGGHVLASASVDGTIKLWGTRHLRCFWTYTPLAPLEQRDPCMRLLLHLPSGTVIAGMRSGKILLWTGFVIDASGDTLDSRNITTISIDTPPPEAHTTSSIHRSVKAIILNTVSTKSISLTLLYDGESCIRKVDVNFDDPTNIDIIMSSPSSHGIFTALRCGATSSRRLPSLITGDKGGWVQIWDTSTLHCSRTWSAHEDGSITVLEVTDHLLATGSSGGSIIIWDALNYQKLRSFATPVPRNLTHVGGDEVTCLVLSDSSVVGCVGNRVVAWRVDRGVPLGLTSKSKTKGGTARYISPKWQGQIEMKKAITESYDVLEDYSSPTTLLASGSTREHQSALNDLGLEEREAVEYVLMLSRDEEEERQRHLLGSSLDSNTSMTSISSRSSSEEIDSSNRSDSDPGTNPSSVHGDDIEHEEIFTMTPIPSPPISPVLAAWSSRRSSVSSSAQLRATPTDSNRKVQVTPPFRPEAVEAGTSPSTFWLDGAMPIPRPHAMQDSDFPAISTSSSPSSRWTGRQPSSFPRASASLSTSPQLQPVSRPTGAKSASGSPPKEVKAWSTVVRTPPTDLRPSNTLSVHPPLAVPRVAQRSTLVPRSIDDEEEMLRLALAASLADM